MPEKTSFSKTTIGERKSSEYGTPLDFYLKLDEVFNFVLDPCAFPDNRLHVPKFYTKQDDGLIRRWIWNTFINPPFGTKKGENIRAWIQKMKKESELSPYYHYVMLLPLRIESRWFQEEILDDYDGLIYAIKGRLVFFNSEKNKNNNPHPIGTVLYIRSNNFTTDMAYRLKELIPGEYICKRPL